MKTLIITDKTENNNISELESLDFSNLNLLILDCTIFHAMQVTHWLSQKFLLNNFTIAFISNDLDHLDLSPLKTMGVSVFGFSKEGVLLALSKKIA